MLSSGALSEFEHVVPKSNSDENNKENIMIEPEPRSGHRIVVTESNLYAIGGYNPDFWTHDNEEDTNYPLFRELWKFNLLSKKWTKLKTTGHMPFELASHSACLFKDTLIVYGGTGIPFGEAASNKLHSCNLKTLEWKNICTKGPAPIPGYGSVIHVVGPYLYVFGGTTGWEYNSDVHRLHLKSLVWEKIESKGTTPEGRYRHESVVYDNKLHIFGGGRALVVFTLEELPVFDLETFTWQYYKCKPDTVHGFPEPRRCHSCVLVNSDVFVCGGYNGDTIYGDLWSISLHHLTWRKLRTHLQRPCYFHSSAVTPHGCMYTFGGVVELEVERTSVVTSVHLCASSLRELAWSTVSKAIQDIDSVPYTQLRELGIPFDLINRRQ